MPRLARILDRLQSSRALIAALFALWCVATIMAVMHHEAWRDEADSWLMARDRSLPEIWAIMRYAGTPMLLYVVEAPFAKAGLPYSVQPWLNWPFAAAAAGMLLVRAPLSLPTRALAAFSYFLAFEYAVVVRGYALTIFFMMLICQLSPRRRAGSFALALSLWGAANATAFGLFFACAYAAAGGLELVVDRSQWTPRVIAAHVVGWLGILVALAQLFPQPEDTAVSETPAVAALARAFGGGNFPYGEPWVRVAVGAVVCVSTLWLLRRSPRAIVVYVLFSSMIAYLFYAKHVGFVRHWGFFLIGSLVARWLSLAERGTTEPDDIRASRTSGIAGILLALVFATWVAEAGRVVVADVQGRFSNAEAMADFLVVHHLDKRDIAAHTPLMAESVLPYLKLRKTFYYPALDEDGSHMWWNKKLAENVHMRTPEMVARIRHRFPRWNDPVRGPLLLTGARLPARDAARWGFKLMHAEAVRVVSTNGESLYLYGPDGIADDRVDPQPP